ncbi:hypothetical protein IW261DRAFT_1298004, partial [Armillaria novae-zelandiae]
GTICSRLETEGDRTLLYLRMTMGILAAENSLTVQESWALVSNSSFVASLIFNGKSIKIYSHVEISNVEVRNFHERHGFQDAGIHKDYCKMIVPHDSWVLEKTV